MMKAHSEKTFLTFGTAKLFCDSMVSVSAWIPWVVRDIRKGWQQNVLVLRCRLDCCGPLTYTMFVTGLTRCCLDFSLPLISPHLVLVIRCADDNMGDIVHEHVTWNKGQSQAHRKTGSEPSRPPSSMARPSSSCTIWNAGLHDPAPGEHNRHKPADWQGARTLLGFQ